MLSSYNAPGPGHYQVHEKTLKNRTFNTKNPSFGTFTERFKEKIVENNKLGPGAYFHYPKINKETEKRKETRLLRPTDFHESTGLEIKYANKGFGTQTERFKNYDGNSGIAISQFKIRNPASWAL